MCMIKSFASKETEKLYNRQGSNKVPATIQQIARRKLEILDAAETLQDLRIPPSNHLEKLSANRKGQYSIRINVRYRVCFTWKDNDAYNVEIIDYH